jgi:hypothetical protein
MADSDGAEWFVCTQCQRTFGELVGLQTHIGMKHKKKVITSRAKRRRRVESPEPGESEDDDATRGPSEAVYGDGLTDGESNDYGSGNDDCVEAHDAVHDEEHDEMLTEILSSLIVGDENDGLQRAVDRSSVGEYLNVLPSWDALDQAGGKVASLLISGYDV